MALLVGLSQQRFESFWLGRGCLRDEATPVCKVDVFFLAYAGEVHVAVVIETAEPVATTSAVGIDECDYLVLLAHFFDIAVEPEGRLAVDRFDSRHEEGFEGTLISVDRPPHGTFVNEIEPAAQAA